MSRERTASLILLLTTCIWGSTFLAGKMGLDAMALHVGEAGRRLIPFWLNLMRFVVAAFLFALVCPRAVRGLRGRELRESFYVAFPGALGIALGGWGLQEASVTVTAFLTNLTVLFTPLFGFLFFREKLNRSLLLGAAIAFVGVFLLTNPSGGEFGRPETLVLLSSVCYGLQIQLIPRYTQGRDAEVMTFGLFLHFVWLSLLPLIPFRAGWEMLNPEFLYRAMGPVGDGRWIDRWAILWSTGYLAVLASVLAMWIFMRYQREIPATRAAILYAFEPVFAALLAWSVLSEPMGWRKVAGGAIILLGNLVCELLKPAPALPSLDVPQPRPES